MRPHETVRNPDLLRDFCHHPPFHIEVEDARLNPVEPCLRDKRFQQAPGFLNLCVRQFGIRTGSRCAEKQSLQDSMPEIATRLPLVAPRHIEAPHLHLMRPSLPLLGSQITTDIPQYLVKPTSKRGILTAPCRVVEGLPGAKCSERNFGECILSVRRSDTGRREP